MANEPMPAEALDRLAALNKQGLTDGEIAAAIGFARTTVSRKRRELGLTANDARFRPTDAQIADLRVMSNHAMQRKYSQCADTWSRTRKRLGIPHYRLPTVKNGQPVSPLTGKPVVEKIRLPDESSYSIRQPAAVTALPRDHSLLGEAAAFLQRERFHVFNRHKVGMGEGWQVGRSVLDDAAMLSKAERLGFQRQSWMGGMR